MKFVDKKIDVRLGSVGVGVYRNNNRCTEKLCRGIPDIFF